MENAALDRNTRAIFAGSLSRDLATTTAIGVISNLVTLYLISTTGAPQLAISAHYNINVFVHFLIWNEHNGSI